MKNTKLVGDPNSADHLRRPLREEGVGFSHRREIKSGFHSTKVEPSTVCSGREDRVSKRGS